MNEYRKWRKMLLSGSIFAFITMLLGEIPIGWTIYTKTGNPIFDLILGSGNLSLLQMASGVLFGGIFIPLQYYGYKAIAMAIPIIKGKTIFPKWAFVLNPLTGKVVLNILALVMPNTAVCNGIRMSNMGLGSLITFVGLWILLEKYQKQSE